MAEVNAAAKEDQISRANELNEEGEARVYRSFRHFWHPVMYTHELDDKPTQAFLCGEQLVIVRLGAEVCAFADLCAHRGTPLSLGTVENNELRCAYHGWQYNVDGECTFIPQNPGLARHLHACVKKYKCEDRYGWIWVCLEDESRFPLPPFPQCDDPELDLEKIYIPTTDWDCSSPRRVENYTDLSHFAILHDGILGNRDKPELPKHKVWREEGGVLRMKLAEASFAESTDSVKYASLNLEEETAVVHRTWWLFMPLTVLLHAVGPGQNVHYCLFFHPTPLAPGKTRNFTIAARNYAKEKAYDELISFVGLVYDQDQPVVEAQRPEELPEDLSLELHVKGADTFSVYYRKWLVELAKELA